MNKHPRRGNNAAGAEADQFEQTQFAAPPRSFQLIARTVAVAPSPAGLELSIPFFHSLSSQPPASIRRSLGSPAPPLERDRNHANISLPRSRASLLAAIKETQVPNPTLALLKKATQVDNKERSEVVSDDAKLPMTKGKDQLPTQIDPGVGCDLAGNRKS